MKHIGLDAHSRECFFVVMGKSGKVFERAKVKTCEKALLGFVRSVKGLKSLAFKEGSISH